MSARTYLFWALLAAYAADAAEDAPIPARPVEEFVRGGNRHSPGNWLKVSGKVQVLNGYTIAFGDGRKVELENGPELAQQGKLDGKLYPAGREAAEFLRKLIADREVTMYINAGTEEYRRGDLTTGECFIGDVNLGTQLILGGWAIADHSLKVSAELIARQNKRGLWRGEFVSPERWRKGERLEGEEQPAAQPAQDAKKDEPPKRESIVGGIAFPPEKRFWTRITGKVTVLSANRLAFTDGTEVNLHWNMKTLYPEQQGLRDGKLYPAGREAADYLRSLIRDREVTFIGHQDGSDPKKMRGPCFVGEVSLEIEMIRGGWAISDHEGMDPFEIMARERKRGLWKGTFIPPEQWRKGQRLPGEPAAEPAPKPVPDPFIGKTPDSPVIRDEVKGSINHGGGKTMWQRVTGKVRVLNAYTLEFTDGTKIELDITVPAPEQSAMSPAGLYPCGQRAAEFLRDYIGEGRVTCYQNDGDGPWSAYVGNDNLERVMTVNGWALADHSSMHADEIIARENKRGLWQGKFIHPDTWRAGVRLPGEAPPPKLKDETAARRLIASYDSDDDALPLIVVRIVSDVPTLRHLNFSQRSRLTDDGLAQLTKLDKLEVLDMAGCSSMTDAGLAHLKAFPHLKQVSLPDMISNAGLAHLAELPELEKLVIYKWRGDPITDDGLAQLKKLSQLKYLTLNGVQTTDAGLVHLRELQNLQVLEFGRVVITDAGLAHLEKLKNLQYLDLSQSEVTDEGMKQLAGLKQLKILLVPERVTKMAKQRMQEAIPEIKFEGRPEDIAKVTPDKP